MSTFSAAEAIVPIAEAIAREAHKGQLRRFNNQEYITHPEAVAAAVNHPTQKIVAWLHDVLEDNHSWTPKRLIERGIPNYFVEAVVTLTKLPGESYYDYIMRINAADGLAAIVKLADLNHNLEDLDPVEHASLRDKYLLAREVLELSEGRG